MDAIIGLDLPKDSFLLSYYCAGVRVGDLIQLRWSNISPDGRISYVMDKTDKVRDLVTIMSVRTAEVYRVKKRHNPKALKQLKKNFENTDPYIHLTYNERMDFLREVADAIGSWSYARIFARLWRAQLPTIFLVVISANCHVVMLSFFG